MYRLIAMLAALVALATPSGAGPARDHRGTATPVTHLVVIFQENVSFDHYFATYPNALNPPGEPRFVARPGTPSVNGLSGAPLTTNPNLANPQRLDRTQALTCGPSNNYTNEQLAADAGAMDHFVQAPGGGPTLAQCLAAVGNPTPAGGTAPIVSQSRTPRDQLTGPGTCGASAAAVPLSDAGGPEQARCGYGPRLPFLVISPYARVNSIDNRLIDQSSVIRFIEDNWGLPRLGDGSADARAGLIDGMFDFERPSFQPLILVPATGLPIHDSR
jgi:phospholipase C